MICKKDMEKRNQEMLNPTYITDKFAQTDPIVVEQPSKNSFVGSFGTGKDSIVEPSIKDMLGLSEVKTNEGPRMSVKDMLINKV